MIRTYFHQLNEDYLKEHRDQALAVLPPWRIERYERMKFEKNKLEELAAGLLLRHALWDAAGISLLDAGIVKNEYGKPVLNGDIHFNISHSDGYIAAAVADCPVGIDVETKTDPDLKVTARFYSEEEQEAVRNAEDPQREFRRIWTRKEAYVKCVGTGISGPVEEIPSLPEVSGEYRIITLRDEDEYALSFVVRSGEASAVNSEEASAEKKLPALQFSLDTVTTFDI